MIESSDSDRPRPRPDASGVEKLAGSESVLAGLGKASWSEEQGVSYEVALDSVNEVIGAYSGLIGREEASTEPDAAKVADWRQAKVATRCASA